MCACKVSAHTDVISVIYGQTYVFDNFNFDVNVDINVNIHININIDLILVVCSNLKIIGAYFVDYSAISTCHRCHEGWKGERCTECIKLEGCSEHGTCNDEPFTCQCETGWTGRFWECPICKKGKVIT